ncbi:MAG: hypothetical protein GYA16_01030 [Spirochaetes bacterium]|nr:hypothetical protein [Spirochaetota bacterium]
MSEHILKIYGVRATVVVTREETFIAAHINTAINKHRVRRCTGIRCQSKRRKEARKRAKV